MSLVPLTSSTPNTIQRLKVRGHCLVSVHSERLFENPENMEYSFEELKREHIQVVDRDRVVERCRPLAGEPDISHSMVCELNNIVHTIIGPLQMVHRFLHQCHNDINCFINASNKFEGAKVICGVFYMDMEIV